MKKRESTQEKVAKYSRKSKKIITQKVGKYSQKKRKVSLKSGKHPPPLNFCYIQCFIVNFKCCFLLKCCFYGSPC